MSEPETQKVELNLRAHLVQDMANWPVHEKAAHEAQATMYRWQAFRYASEALVCLLLAGLLVMFVLNNVPGHVSDLIQSHTRYHDAQAKKAAAEAKIGEAALAAPPMQLPEHPAPVPPKTTNIGPKGAK